MKTLEKIEQALNNGTNKCWHIENNTIKTCSGSSDDGTDYSVTLEHDGILVCTSGMSHACLTRKSLVKQMNSWIAVDDSEI